VLRVVAQGSQGVTRVLLKCFEWLLQQSGFFQGKVLAECSEWLLRVLLGCC